MFQAIVRHFLFNETLNDAVQAKRVHHQLAPMQLDYEENFPDVDILRGLANIGHVLNELSSDSGFAAITAISMKSGNIEAVTDNRRPGSTSVF